MKDRKQKGRNYKRERKSEEFKENHATSCERFREEKYALILL